MKEENHIQLFSFEINRGVIQKIFDNHPIYYLQLPKDWLSIWKEKKDKKKFNFYMYQLNETIKRTFPSIFYANIRNEKYWLLSFEPIEQAFLQLLYKQFLVSFDQVLPPSNELQKIKWERIQHVEDMEKEIYYNWIPAFFSYQFAASGKKHLYINPNNKEVRDFSVLNEKVSFYPIKFNNKYECMSDVIQNTDYNGVPSERYSYIIKFSYQNRAKLLEEGILNVKFGIRRYITNGIRDIHDIRYNRRGSMLIQLESSLLENASTFAHWQYEKRAGTLKWTEGIRQFMKQRAFGTLTSYKPEEILKDPLSFSKGSMKVLPVYSDQVFINKSLMKTEAGIGLREKHYLFELVEECFPYLHLLEKGREVKRTQLRNGNNETPFVVPNEDLRHIRLEIWGRESLREHFIEQNEDLLEKQIGDSNKFILKTDGKNIVLIDIVQMDPTNIIRARSENEKARTYMDATIDQLNDISLEKNTLILSLIEIEEPHKYGKYYDPKQLLKESFARTGRLTQFIHPIQEKSDRKIEGEAIQRLRNSMKDLLNNIGICPPRVRNMKLDEHIIFSAGMIQKGSSSIPVVSQFSLEEPLRVKLFTTKGSGWKLFHEALLQFHTHRDHAFIKRKDAAWMVTSFVQFIGESLEEVAEKTDKKIIFMIDEVYRSYQMKEVTNKHISQLLPKIQSLVSKKYRNRIRIVRISNHEEIPQYRIWNKSKGYLNYNSGLFTTNEELYYSIALRMDNMRSIHKNTIKYGAPSRFLVQQSLVELVVLGCESVEESDEIATIVHWLRRASLTSDKGTIQPYPLHLNKVFRSYLSLQAKSSRNGTGIFNQEDHSFSEKISLNELEVEQLTFPFEYEIEET
ncbi:pPIWI_RE module domain-containing protein [Pseudogracilibacillus sp. ICA-222130]|uniref:pPIWI_RE module domain-containing protein n=1 Tax=Pseudogracilibacillus sp. ICA-222130 TaxID=3134655 RepID=UPI0030BD60C6